MPQEFKPSYTFSEDRLNELKQLFPEAFEDGVFNVDTLKELIGEFATDNNTKEHFGLNWVGKLNSKKLAAKPPTGTLKSCIGEGENEEITGNIFIEGENLEVLKILRKSYMGKIKMIYIDPPYNTGKDFIYNDTFADSTEDYLRRTGQKSDEGVLVSNAKTSGRFHADWLTFIYSRLKLAKDLLKEEGVIFISIDEVEFSKLRLIMDEIFGEQNHIADFVWQNKKGGGNDSKYVAVEHEYLLMYAKNEPNLHELFEPYKPEYLKRYKEEDEIGKFFWDTFKRKSGKQYYPITCPDGEVLEFDNKGNRISWLRSESRFLDDLEKGEVKFTKINDNWSIHFKQRLPKGKKPRTVYLEESIWRDKGTNSNGSSEVLELFGKEVFSHPKPINLLKHIISFNLKKGDLILDFFAGSGSLLQAVLEYQKETKDEINFIGIQIKEEISNKTEEGKNALSLGYNYISEITKDRIIKSLKKYELSSGFKFFKQNSSTIYKWNNFNPDKDGGNLEYQTQLELAYKNPLVDGVETQDFITEVILQEGFPLTAKQEEIVSGVFKITHEWIPYTLYASMLYSFKDTDFSKIQLQDTDHLVCLDKAFEGNDSLKQMLDNQCKLFTI